MTAGASRLRRVKLQPHNIVMVLALLVIGISIPFSIMDTIETGRMYIFSHQFLAEIPQRFKGPGRLRFVLQAAVAILLGVRVGLADARGGNAPYLFRLFFDAGNRRALLHSGVAVISNLLAFGIILDLVFQRILYGAVHPGAALLIGPILICIPYSISRSVTTRLARWRARK